VCYTLFMPKTRIRPPQHRELDQLAKASQEVRDAQDRLERLIREGADHGLRPVWMAEATGLARSTIYLILARGQ
jgi:hypothetical protein